MSQQHTIKEAVHVSITLDGVSIEQDFAPGDYTLPKAIADLLESQGLATPTTSKKKIAPVIDEPAPAEA